MVLEEMMEQTDNGVGPLSCIAGFINEVVDLPWDGFTTYPKDSALSRGQEVNGARLERVRRIVDLLCHIKRIVDWRGERAGREPRERRWWSEDTSLLEKLPHIVF